MEYKAERTESSTRVTAPITAPPPSFAAQNRDYQAGRQLFLHLQRRSGRKSCKRMCQRVSRH